MIGIGKRIKLLRVERDMNQTQLGELLGVSQSALAHYESETRKIDLDVVGKLCEVFDVTADWLIGLSEERTKENKQTDILDGLSDNDKRKVESYAGYVKAMQDKVHGEESCTSETIGGRSGKKTG